MDRNKLTESRSGKSAVVNSLLQALAARGFEKENHARNVQESAKSIVVKRSLPNYELPHLKFLGTLHDIGKINIPENLPNEDKALNTEEWDLVKKHCKAGYHIAKSTDEFAHDNKDILAHQEHGVGSNYQQGLKGR